MSQINYRDHIALNLATAHPHYDSEGNTYNMGTAMMSFGLPKYVIFKVPGDASGAFLKIIEHVVFQTNDPFEAVKLVFI